MDLKMKIKELETRIAALEVQAQEQPISTKLSDVSKNLSEININDKYVAIDIDGQLPESFIKKVIEGINVYQQKNS